MFAIRFFVSAPRETDEAFPEVQVEPWEVNRAMQLVENGLSISDAEIVVLMDEAYRRSGRPEFMTARDSILSGEPKSRTNSKSTSHPRPGKTRAKGHSAPAPSRWDEDRLRRLQEKIVLGQMLIPTAEFPNLLFRDEDSGLVRAIGCVEMDDNTTVRLEIHFPEDYPRTAPRALVLQGTRTSGDSEDSIVIPPPESGWRRTHNSGCIVEWSVEWLRRGDRLSALQQEDQTVSMCGAVA